MITVNHVLSSRTLHSKIFDDLFQRLLIAVPNDIALSQTVRPDRLTSLRHYHRPHRELRLITPAIVTVHHDPRDTYSWLNTADFIPRWREAGKIICLNSTQKKLLADFGIFHTEVIPHGIDRQAFPYPAAPRQAAEVPVRLGIVSKRHLRGVKGEARLQRLFDNLSPQHFSFVLAGEGRWHDADAAARRGFAVECYEKLPYRIFGSLYKKIDVLLILSDFEGGPACLPEALGSGVPVAAMPVGMVPDWIGDQVNGLLLDDATLIDQIRSLSDPDLLCKLNAGAFAVAHQVPTWDETFAQYIALYRVVAEIA